MNCTACGKHIEGEGIAFCPYCGAKLTGPETGETPDDAAKVDPLIPDPEGEKWVRKAMEKTAYPDRKKILLKGREACPDNPAIEWELLFIGEEEKGRRRSIDYSVIKSWILEIYRKPGDFSAERRDRMRGELFDAPQLKKTLAMFEDPEKKQKEYLTRLCREYIDIFLEGNSQVMGTIFGFQFGRNPEKRIAEPVAEMIGRMREDEKLSPEQREQLWQSLYQAYAAKTKGNTGYLDELMPRETTDP